MLWSFFAVRIKLAKIFFYAIVNFSLLFNFLCQQRKLQRNCIALEKGLLPTAITQFLFKGDGCAVGSFSNVEKETN